MNQPDLTNRLDHLVRPTPSAEALKSAVKLTLVSVRGSSRWGALLITVPAVFVFGVLLHYGFGISVPGFATMENSLSWIENHWGTLPTALILVGAPLLALVLNLLALSHIQLDHERREFRFTLKLRPANIVIAVLAGFIVALVMLHIIAERSHHIP